MNNQTNEPRVEPPRVSYRGKEALRRLPQKTTYPFKIWAAAASVAVMVGAGLALWSGTQSETPPPTVVSQTINVPAEPTEKIDTTTIVEVRLNATQITTKAKPRTKATEAEPKAKNATERRMAVARIEAERQTIRLSSVPPTEILALAAAPQEQVPTTNQEESKQNKRLKIKFTNPFEAFAIDWEDMVGQSTQDIEHIKERFKDAPNKFSNLLALFKLKEKEEHYENN